LSLAAVPFWNFASNTASRTRSRESIGRLLRTAVEHVAEFNAGRPCQCSGVVAARLGFNKGGPVLFMVVLIFAGYWKNPRGRRSMMETFPEGYPEYRRRVKALIPGIL
jgi:hypothetical protein